MKKLRKEKAIWYIQGGEEMNEGMIMIAIEAAHVILNILDDWCWRKKVAKWLSADQSRSPQFLILGSCGIFWWSNEDKFAGEMKKLSKEKEVWYIQGGGEMGEGTIVVIIEAANAILDALDDW